MTRKVPSTRKRWNKAAAALSVVLLIVLGSAQAKSELALPDRIVLEQSATLPDGINEHDIQCAIIEERNDVLIISTSPFRGIRERIEIPREDIALVERGDPGAREFSRIEPLLKSPPDSRSPEFYRQLVDKHLEPFLEKFPDHPMVPQVRIAIDIYRVEEKFSMTGKIKTRGVWFSPNQYQRAKPDILAMEWRDRTSESHRKRNFSRFVHQLEQLPQMKQSRLFPALLKDTRSWIPDILEGMSAESLKEEMEREVAWIESKIRKFEVLVNQIKNQEVTGNFSPDRENITNQFYNTDDWMWYSLEEATLDEESGEILRVTSLSDKSRISRIENKISSLKKRRQNIFQEQSRLQETLASSREFLKESLDTTGESSLEGLTTLITTVDQNTIRLANEFVFDPDSRNVEEILSSVLNHTRWINGEIEAITERREVWKEWKELERYNEVLTTIQPLLDPLQKKNWGGFSSSATQSGSDQSNPEDPSNEDTTESAPELGTVTEAFTKWNRMQATKNQQIRNLLHDDGPQTSEPEPAKSMVVTYEEMEFSNTQNPPVKKIDVLEESRSLLILLSPEEIFHRWKTLRLMEIDRIQSLASHFQQEASRSIASEDVPAFLQATRQAMLLAPHHSGKARLYQLANDHFYGLLASGKIQPARKFQKEIAGIDLDPRVQSEWKEEFTWVNLWGYGRYLNQLSTISLFGIAAVSIVLVISLILSVYLVIRKFVLKKVIRRH